MTDLSPSTTNLLLSISSFSGGKLTHRKDLGMLIEIARRQKKDATLDELSFLAKFVSRAYGIMQRIGKDGEGYDRIAKQFSSNMENASGLAKSLLEGAPADVREYFTTTYFALTTTSMRNLLDLFYDLSWYKNWLIDHPATQR